MQKALGRHVGEGGQGGAGAPPAFQLGEQNCPFLMQLFAFKLLI